MDLHGLLVVRRNLTDGDLPGRRTVLVLQAGLHRPRIGGHPDGKEVAVGALRHGAGAKDGIRRIETEEFDLLDADIAG